VRLTGHGRVAIQSVYQPAEECEPITDTSIGTTRHRW
jgi:hypothetical protein